MTYGGPPRARLWNDCRPIRSRQTDLFVRETAGKYRVEPKRRSGGDLGRCGSGQSQPPRSRVARERIFPPTRLNGPEWEYRWVGKHTNLYTCNRCLYPDYLSEAYFQNLSANIYSVRQKKTGKRQMISIIYFRVVICLRPRFIVSVVENSLDRFIDGEGRRVWPLRYGSSRVPGQFCFRDEEQGTRDQFI